RLRPRRASAKVPPIAHSIPTARAQAIPAFFDRGTGGGGGRGGRRRAGGRARRPAGGRRRAEGRRGTGADGRSTETEETGGQGAERRRGASAAGVFQALAQLADRFHQFRFLLEAGPDFLVGVQDGAVVAPAEFLPDAGEGRVGELPGQVHGQLAGEGHVAVAVAGAHGRGRQVEVLRDHLLDGRDGDGGLVHRSHVLEGLHGQIHGDRRPVGFGEGQHLGERALQLAHVGL